jgi:hypothetical protein
VHVAEVKEAFPEKGVATVEEARVRPNAKPEILMDLSLF